MALLITGCSTATPKAIHLGVTRPLPTATIAHPMQAEKVACAQVTGVTRSQASGSEACSVTDGWIIAMERSGDATLARVGNEWSNLATDPGPPGGTTVLMPTATAECRKLGLHRKASSLAYESRADMCARSHGVLGIVPYELGH
jgi:hypothetical protein